MITNSPYGIDHVTRPGYGEPEPLKPVFCYDPPEVMAICLDCPIPDKCCSNKKACPLYGQSAAAKRKRRLRERGGIG